MDTNTSPHTKYKLHSGAGVFVSDSDLHTETGGRHLITTKRKKGKSRAEE